jgi:hypothetical protein
MMMIKQQTPVLVYQVTDRAGRPIGTVVEPKAEPVLGKGEGTILLIRG